MASELTLDFGRPPSNDQHSYGWSWITDKSIGRISTLFFVHNTGHLIDNSGTELSVVTIYYYHES